LRCGDGFGNGRARHGLNAARRMKHTDDLQWFRFVRIDHRVRMDEKALMNWANSSGQWRVPGFFASLTIVVSR
jgi:hypothetical protein